MTENFQLTEEKLEIVNRCIEHAKQQFDDDCKRFGQLTWWDDGDFRVKIKHGVGTEGGYRDEKYKHHAERIAYKSSAGRIVYSEFVMDMLGCEERAIEEYVIEEMDDE